MILSAFTPDDPLALALTGIALLIVAAALVYTNHKLRD